MSILHIACAAYILSIHILLVVYLLKSTDFYCVPSATPKSTYHSEKGVKLQSSASITQNTAFEITLLSGTLLVSLLCLVTQKRASPRLPRSRPNSANDEAYSPLPKCQHLSPPNQTNARETTTQTAEACEALRAQPRSGPHQKLGYGRTLCDLMSLTMMNLIVITQPDNF